MDNQIKNLSLCLISSIVLFNPLPINIVRLFSKGIAYFVLCIPAASTSFREVKWSSISPPIIIIVVGISASSQKYQQLLCGQTTLGSGYFLLKYSIAPAFRNYCSKQLCSFFPLREELNNPLRHFGQAPPNQTYPHKIGASFQAGVPRCWGGLTQSLRNNI